MYWGEIKKHQRSLENATEELFVKRSKSLAAGGKDIGIVTFSF